MLAGDFLFVVVGYGGPIVDLAEAIDHAGIGEDGGGELRLAGTAVTNQSDVADAGRVVDLHSWELPGYPIYASYAAEPSLNKSQLQGSTLEAQELHDDQR